MKSSVLCVWLLVAWGAQPARGAPKAPQGAALAAYRGALKAGRAAHKRGDFAAARAAFSRALIQAPEDPRALQERGWTRYKAGDLAGAEADTRRALSGVGSARLRGACEYNLGRVLEDRGDKEGAKAAYIRSRSVRPNEVVTARLRKLDPNWSPPPGPPKPLAGPFADEAAVCRFLEKKALEDGTKGRCGPMGPPTAGAPFDPRVIHLYLAQYEGQEPSLDGLGVESWNLVLRTAKGRYVLPNVASAYNPGIAGIMEEAGLKRLRRRRLSSGQAVLWVRAYNTRYDSDLGFNEAEEWERRWIYACGVGPSGAPSCAGPFPQLEEGERHLMLKDDPTPLAAGESHNLWKLKARFSVRLLPRGAVRVEARGRPSEQLDLSAVGTHPLRFP